MKVDKNNYDAVVERYMFIEDLLNTAYEVVWGLTDMHTELSEALKEYDNRQKDLDS